MNDKPVLDPSLVSLTSAAERRMAVQAANQRKVSERRNELQQLTSFVRTPAERVEAWERIFQLKLPRSLEHPLIVVIVTSTGLTIDEIDAELRRRRAQQQVSTTPNP
jgi:predicted amidophosphoribosyltransferase